jgi:hypothetical protein
LAIAARYAPAAMLDDLDRSLRALLFDELPRVVERIEADGFDISFDVPNRENTARLTRPTLNLFLFHIQENRDLRPGPWQSVRLNGDVRDERPPVRLECHYLVTAWSNEVDDEHRLLTGAARAFFRNPVLPEAIAEGSLAETDFDLPLMVAQPAQLKDIVDIWSVLDNDLRPSVRLNVIVPLELDVEIEKRIVLERRIELPPPEPIADPRRRVDVAGVLVRAGEPVAGARVRMDRSSATTRADGTFNLHGVPAGWRGVLIAHDGEVFRIDPELAVGETPAGEPFALDLADANGGGNGNGAGETNGAAGDGSEEG